jgi:HAD superfamily hydrolase (TIGR01509 family)
VIKVIAFDYAEVIAEGPMSKWVRANLEADSKLLVEYKKSAHKWDLGEMTLSEVYEILGKYTSIPPEMIWKNFYEKSKPNLELISLIKILKKRYKIILFSNFISEMLRKLLNHYEITELFDEIIISSEHKLKKPDPKFFEVLIKKSGVKKNEIIFTDDKITTVIAANGLGIKSFVFTNTETFIDDLKKEGITV